MPPAWLTVSAEAELTFVSGLVQVVARNAGSSGCEPATEVASIAVIMIDAVGGAFWNPVCSNDNRRNRQPVAQPGIAAVNRTGCGAVPRAVGAIVPSVASTSAPARSVSPTCSCTGESDSMCTDATNVSAVARTSTNDGGAASQRPQLIREPRLRTEVRAPEGNSAERGRVDDEQRGRRVEIATRRERVGAEAAGIDRARPPMGRVQPGDDGRGVGAADPGHREDAGGPDLGQRRAGSGSS